MSLSRERQRGGRAPIASGMTLIDVLVGSALLLVVFLALFGALRASLSLSAIDQAEATAVEVANTQMEYLRGLNYEALGTQGGIPSGFVPQYATSTVDGAPYVVHTFIDYYDDPADGTGTADTNGITTDYKKAVVSVSYAAGGFPRLVTLASNFAPPGIESNTAGGTLDIHVVDASDNAVSGASVRIVNASTSPAIDFTTLTDSSGMVSIGGATSSPDYQIYVSKSGDSSAQTYPRTAINVNPTPGFLTVRQDQTTTSTFAIDRLATLIISSFSPATTTVFSDSFASTANLAGEKNAIVSDGSVQLASGALSGSVQSIPISPSYLDSWGLLNASLSTPSGASVVVRVLDASGNLLPDSVLAGNSTGFSSFPVSLIGVSTTSYPTLALSATLSRSSTSTNPDLRSWSLSHTQGPEPFPNSRFLLTGTKTIGSTASSAPLYKTQVTGITGSTGSVTETLEWDAYTLSASTTVLESCPPGPYQLAPGSATSTKLVQGSLGNASLGVTVMNTQGGAIGNARVVLSSPSFAAALPTDACGVAYFAAIAPGTYSLVTSAPGYTTMSDLNLPISGQATTTVSLSLQ